MKIFQNAEEVIFVVRIKLNARKSFTNGLGSVLAAATVDHLDRGNDLRVWP